MADIKWDHSAFRKSAHDKAMDGVEECATALVLTEAKTRCPVAPEFGGTMRDSLGVERDDKNARCYVGGGGAAAAYIFRQHQDLTLNHTTGYAKFISDAVDIHVDNGDLKRCIEKHLNK